MGGLRWTFCSLLSFDNKTDAVAAYYGILAGSTFKVLISDKIDQREKADTKIEGDNSKILEFRARESQVVVAYGWVSQVDNIFICDVLHNTEY